MSVQRRGPLWLATLRALLGLRRDNQQTGALDQRALGFLQDMTAGGSDEDLAYMHLQTLLRETPTALIGAQLTNYLDFNAMGNLVVAIMTSRDLDASLSLLTEYPTYLFTDAATFQVQRHEQHIALRWKANDASLSDGLLAYVLLALFRYQAGQRFDFSTVALPDAADALLSPVSQAARHNASACTLEFAAAWLREPSFHHNPALNSAIEKSLTRDVVSLTRDRVIALIEAAPFPARLRLPGVAEQLGLSDMSLRKQLKHEGVVFSSLLKTAIHELATQQLLAGDRVQAVSDELGFSDRRAFDRSFKDFTGINPGQLRSLGRRLRFQRGNQQLKEIVTSLPPLPKTVRSILALDDDAMRVQDVVPLIDQDPIFRAHIMAKASKAVFGRTPATLVEALSRNLGLGNIKSLAVLFAANQQLAGQSLFHDIERLTDGMLLSAQVCGQLAPAADQDLLLFGLLSLLVLFHEDCVFSHRIMTIWQDAEHFSDFRQQVNEELGVCLYGASSLMLLKWGMSGDINRQLWTLCGSGQTAPDQAINPIHLSHDIAMSTELPQCSDDVTLARYKAILPENQQQRVRALLEAW